MSIIRHICRCEVVRKPVVMVVIRGLCVSDLGDDVAVLRGPGRGRFPASSLDGVGDEELRQIDSQVSAIPLWRV